MKDSYHHGNLKQDLIEASIRIISEQGFEALSLRTVSALCGVSHNAIYRHFESKEQLIAACRKYVTEQIMACLSKALAGTEPASAEAVQCFGAAYLSFYQQYPTYYSALYRNTDVKLVFSVQETAENYPPLELFHHLCFAYGARIGWMPEETLTRMTQMWSLLHGLTALVISSNVEWNRDWQKCLGNIIG